MLNDPAMSISGMRVVVTGATGFIGRYLVDALLKQGAHITILSRCPASTGARDYKTVVGDLTQPATINTLCRNIDTVFHLGGHAHAVDLPEGKDAKTIYNVTVEGTRALLEQAISCGVRRFVLFSSVKTMGEGGDACLDENSRGMPASLYGKAKRAAENIVMEADRGGLLSSTILRLPMVYGPGCKGNLPRMIQAIQRGRFPPLPETGNKRSLVDVRDVVQAALLAVTNPVAAGKIYIVTDGQAYSTRQIYEWISEAAEVSVPRWIIPLSVLRVAAYVGDNIGRITGRRFIFDTPAFEKLTGSAWYSSEKISRELNYRPIHTLKNSLPAMVMELRSFK